jgi:hypothetical protein
VRLSLLGASAAIAAALALSACNNGTGSSAAMPLSGAQVQATSHGHKLLTRVMPGVKMLTGPACGSEYNFCFYVIPGDSGPYVETSDDTSPLYNVGSIVKSKNDKVDKKFSDYFYPDPGDPTYQYIDYKGKTPKEPGTVKFTDIYCISFTPSGCTKSSGSILHLGIAIDS